MATSLTKIAIVTGTSSGIGEALAWLLVDRGWQVIGLSRRAATIRSDRYTQVEVDLADVAGLTAVLNEQVLPRVKAAGVIRLGLVNNAADVALLGTLAQVDPAAMLRSYAINVVAPVVLMGWLLRSAGDLPTRIANISSGAGVEPLPGLGAYGATKAALRLAGMVMAVELEGEKMAAASARDVTIWSYEPGIVDTPMQTAVRDSSAQTVPMVAFFKEYAAAGKLRTADLPATEIADYLESSGQPGFSEKRFVPE